MTPEQFGRLPRRVQLHIEKLEADVAYWRERAHITSGNKKTRTMLQFYNDHPIYLPEDDPIVFGHPTNDESHEHVMVNRVRHPSLAHRIRVSATSSRIWVEPQAANVIEVWAAR